MEYKIPEKDMRSTPAFSIVIENPKAVSVNCLRPTNRQHERTPLLLSQVWNLSNACLTYAACAKDSGDHIFRPLIGQHT